MAAYDPSGLPDMSEEQPQQTNGEYDDAPQDAGEEDEEDYDPSSFDFGGSTNQADPTPFRPEDAASKPRMVGGFVMDESEDDEEDDTDMSNVATPAFHPNGPEPAPVDSGAAMAAATAAEHEVTAGEDVPLASEPTQDFSLPGSTAAATVAPPASLTLPVLPAAIASSHALSSEQLAAEQSTATSLTADTAAITPPQPQHDASDGKQALSPPTAAAQIPATPQPSTNGISAPSALETIPAALTISTSQRLPHDKVGRLEDRLKADPKADVEAWWTLLQHYRDKDQLDNARSVFTRMLEVWPMSPTVFLQSLAMETETFDRDRINLIFGAALPATPSLPLWAEYLSYLRRVFPLVPDPQGTNRSTITSAFEHVLNNVGHDPDSANLWREHVEFVKSGPGVLGGAGWQDLQKVDLVRKAYQSAIKVPSGNVVALWKDYDAFELLHNRAGARKVLQEMSPHYMTARTAEKQVQGILAGLDRANGCPALPPVEGCEGDDAFAAQVHRWRAWVEWEKSDPLVLRDEDVALYRKRILFVYKQAVIFLRFWPRIWYEAAEWCSSHLGAGVEELLAQGEAFLDEGLKANPESVLLTLKKADRLEEGMQGGGSGDDSKIIADGQKLEDVFDPCHVALYALNKKIGERAKKAVEEIKAYYANLPPEEEDVNKDDQDDDDASTPDSSSPIITTRKSRADQLADALKSVQLPLKAQQKTLGKTISALWIAKMRAFRRVQGQGGPNRPKKGFRGVFAEARPRGQLSADVYVASALMEHHCYKDPSALKIFERGLKLFPTDEEFAVGYVGHLISVNDLVNARVVFETTVGRIMGAVKIYGEGERRGKVRVLLNFMHGFESAYGDLAQVRRLEGRLKELDAPLDGAEGDGAVGQGDGVWAERFTMQGFDATGVQLVMSPRQIQPKQAVPMITMPDGGRVPMPMPMPPQASGPGSPGGGAGGLRLGPNGPFVAAASPKRAFDGEGTDDEGRARKYMRAESPLKGVRRGPGHAASTSLSGSGVAGAGNGSGGSGGFMTKNYQPGGATTNAAPAPPQVLSLPKEVTLLMQVLPPPHTWQHERFDGARYADLLRGLDLARARL
ncbi:mRNA 3'-end-processing protein rna14 [Teratosphaeriaceae sp. CCFEE 6253]|nr:mRNA 3'-end-processing protein rna14 [Teratosphaeriaceae sp. CCFEE 6253]